MQRRLLKAWRVSIRWKDRLIFHGNAHVLSISEKNKIAISVFVAGYRRLNGEVVYFYHIYLFKRRN